MPKPGLPSEMTAGSFYCFVAFASGTKVFTAKKDWIASWVALLAMTDNAPAALLQKTLRIDVDLELEIALGLWACRKPLPQILRQIDAPGGFYQKPETIAALDHRKRGFGGPQHLDPWIDRRDRGQPARIALRSGSIARGNDQAG